jgi:cell division transport system permease protein
MALRPGTLLYHVREAAHSIARNSWLALASAGVVTVTLLIFGSSVLFVLNTHHVIRDIESKVEISIFLKRDVSPRDVETLGTRLRQRPEVADVRFISKEEALQIVKQDLGDKADLLAGLEKDNPLPDTYRVRTHRADQVPVLAAEVAAWSGVEQVRYGQEVVERLLAVTRWARLVGVGAMCFLAGAAVFLIATTIRLSVYARRREIGIMKMLGATNWFVRSPFLLEGVILGLTGGLVAVGLTMAGYFPLVKVLENALPFFRLVSERQVLLPVFGGLVLFGLLLGTLGSFISVHRFLKV